MTAQMTTRFAVLLLSTLCLAVPALAEPGTYASCENRQVPSVSRVLTDTAGSFGRLPTQSNGAWLAAAGVAALAARPADEPIARRMPASGHIDDILAPGDVIGSTAAQLGTGAAVYLIGRLTKSA